MAKENLIPLNVRIPRTLKELMKQYINLDAHKDLSELTRDALREKIKKDAPELYQQLFQKDSNHHSSPSKKVAK